MEAIMQRAYFLGGASPTGFSTSFWTEHSGYYGYYLKGGPGTGKSTLMKRIAADFAGEDISCWHCASDPHSLDAVVLEERGIFIADATAPHESGTQLPYVTGETVDLAEGLSPLTLRENRTEIIRLLQENTAAHCQVRRGLSGILEMESMISDAAAPAVQREKLAGFAARFGRRLLPKASGSQGCIFSRQSMALTPDGIIRYLPDGFDLMLVHDPMRVAGEMFLKQLAESAAEAGTVCEVTRSLTRPEQPPVMLIFPALRFAVVTVTDAAAPDLPASVSCIKMQRFYDAAVLRKHRSLIRFSSKTAAQTEQKVTALLAEALCIHDQLESYYVRALDTAFLDRKAAGIIADIRECGRFSVL